jgi:hypothetical protein
VGSRAGQDECEKSRFHQGIDPRTVQPVVSGYTDYTGLLTLHFTIHILIMDGAVVIFGVVYYEQRPKKILNCSLVHRQSTYVSKEKAASVFVLFQQVLSK